MSDPKPFEAVRDYGQQHMGWPEVYEEKPVDHTAEAERLTEEVTAALDEGVFESAKAQVALLHATLASLAQSERSIKEQHIANLIAFEEVAGEKNRALIREGLGL